MPITAIITSTRCVAMPSLMSARWVGQNYGPIFAILWTKVHQIKFACVGVSVVCLQCHFPTDNVSFFWRYSWSSRNVARNRAKFLTFLGRQILWVRDHPNFWPNFINMGQHQTRGKVWCRSAKRPWRLGGEKEQINCSSKTEWLMASTAGRRA